MKRKSPLAAALPALCAALSLSLLIGCEAVGSIGSPGGGPTGNFGSGGFIPVTTGSGSGGAAGTSTLASSGLPCDVQSLLANRCTLCHSSPPLAGVPMPLVTLANLTAPSHSDPTRSAAALSLARMQDRTAPMPPAPYPPATASEIAAFGSWVSGGYQAPACGSAGTGGATGSDAGVAGTDAGHGGTGGAGGTGGTGVASGLPCDVQAVLSAACTSCHSSPPLAGVPMSLVTYADLTAPSHSDPTRTAAQVSVTRMQSAAMPMPPAPGTPATAAQIATLMSWISGGYARGTCGSTGGADGGAGDAGTGPYDTPPKCTSGKTTPSGGGSANMDPGQACINCHSQGGEAPRFAIAGTVYPTAHEPDNCNGVNGTNGATVVIVGANGQSITLTPNSVGNFSYAGSVSTPFTAKVTFMGRERLMTTPQTSGDCNFCHTQNGASSAPGRIMLP